mgnify:CR=1 FL=1
MMSKIIKRNGKLQDFDFDKIGRSIKSSARDCNIIINESDVKLICNLVNSKTNKLNSLNKERLISSLELKIILYESLRELGFSEIAKNYIEI